jgi:ABC-2 type transport system permease protein
VNLTIARITARALFGRRRFLMLLAFPVLLIAIAILAQSLGADLEQWGEPVIVALGIAIMLPVVALIVGTGVLGSEIDDGTLAHVLAKPLPRSEIILSKLYVAIIVTALTTGIPLFLCALIGGSVSLGLGLLFGAVVGSIAYSALFMLLSLLTRVPVLVGLAYILVWEGLLGRFLTGTSVLSIEQYVLTLAERVSHSDILSSKVSLPVALAMTFIFAVGATLLAIDRLRSFSVVGETS